MHMRTMPAVLLFPAFGLPLAAQQYKVEFTLQDGASRARYSMVVDDSRRAVFQATSSAPGVCAKAPYPDTGATIAVTVRAASGQSAAIAGTLEVSQVTGQVSLSSICEPIVGQRKIVFDTTAVLGKTTAIQTGAAPDRPVEVVVTKLN